jgi:hypothetical protein
MGCKIVILEVLMGGAVGLNKRYLVFDPERDRITVKFEELHYICIDTKFSNYGSCRETDQCEN